LSNNISKNHCRIKSFAVFSWLYCYFSCYFCVCGFAIFPSASWSWLFNQNIKKPMEFL